MTIRYLNVFIQVADSGSMTKAAKKLFIAQPSVSQTIKELEDYYNVKLFERLSRRLYITETGKELLSYARHIVSSYNEMERKIKQSNVTSQLKIAASMTIGTCLLGGLYNRYLEKHPNAHVEVIVDNTSIIEDMVLKSQIDFALVEGPIHSPDIVSKPFMNDELILICAYNHPFRTKGNVYLKDLEEENLILREPGSGTRELFENTIVSRGLDVNIKAECNGAGAIKNAVMSNMGISVISKMIVDEELKSKKLFHITIKDALFKRKFNIIYHKNKYISKPIEEFWNLCFSLNGHID